MERREIPIIVKCSKCNTEYEETVDTFSGVYRHYGYWDGLTARTQCPKCKEINERQFKCDFINELFRRVLYSEERIKKLEEMQENE